MSGPVSHVVNGHFDRQVREGHPVLQMNLRFFAIEKRSPTFRHVISPASAKTLA